MVKKEKQHIQIPTNENFLSIYSHFVYTLIGRKLLTRKKFRKTFYSSIYNKKYEEVLKKANLKIMPEEYFVTVYISIISSMILILLVSISSFIFNPTISFILFSILFVGTIIFGIFLYNYPLVLSRNREAQIDAAMPYLMPYLKILSKELSLSKIIEIIDDFIIYKEIKEEFKKIKYYSNFLGYDTHSSIREAMSSCPSKKLSDLLNDIVTISNAGGDVHSYLEKKVNNLNQEINALENKNIEILLIYSQIYVVLLLIAPLFFTIMFSILNLISINLSSSGSGAAIANNIVSNDLSPFFWIFAELIVLPFLYVGFMMLVYYSKPLYSRLETIKDEKKK
jgi:archaellum biogenesis protein FlaJ (TadC family)